MVYNVDKLYTYNARRLRRVKLFNDLAESLRDGVGAVHPYTDLELLDMLGLDREDPDGKFLYERLLPQGWDYSLGKNTYLGVKSLQKMQEGVEGYVGDEGQRNHIQQFAVGHLANVLARQIERETVHDPIAYNWASELLPYVGNRFEGHIVKPRIEAWRREYPIGIGLPSARMFINFFAESLLLHRAR